MEKDNLFYSLDKNNAPVRSARASAIRVLSRFERSDSYIDKLMASEHKKNNMNQQERALFTEIVNGVIRWKGKIDYILVGFYHGDYMKCLNIVKNALRVALYQMLFLDKVPVSAAINESVEIVKRVQGNKTAGLVNGVLRNIARNVDNIRYPSKEEDPVYYFAVMYSYPRWMVRRWLNRYGEKATLELLEYNNRIPDLPIRVNTMLAESEEIESLLRENDLQYVKFPYTESSFLVHKPRFDFSKTKLFAEGKITIQDPSATLAAALAAPRQGQSVLDLCAAPGGKSFCFAEAMNDIGSVTANEKYEFKLQSIEESAKRLKLNSISVMSADARNIKLEQAVDIVFIDAPCSGLGTIAKKPDIKWKKERDDVITITKLQRDILDNAAGLVGPGGVIVYSTCTIEPEENEDNIRWFLEKHPEFELEPAEKFLPKEVCSNGFMQTLPHVHHVDGAFAARLRKRESE